MKLINIAGTLLNWLLLVWGASVDRGVEMSGSRGGRRELMAGQLGVWHAQQLNPDNPIYNMGEYIEIHGKVNTRLFEAAARRVVQEVDCFHLCFEGTADEIPQQYFDPRSDWPFHVIDVSGEGDPRSGAESWMRADMRRPVDLQGGEPTLYSRWTKASSSGISEFTTSSQTDMRDP